MTYGLGEWHLRLGPTLIKLSVAAALEWDPIVDKKVSEAHIPLSRVPSTTESATGRNARRHGQGGTCPHLEML